MSDQNQNMSANPADERAKCQEAIKVLAEALQRVSGLPCVVNNDQNDICGVTYTCPNCQVSLLALTALSDPTVQAVMKQEKHD